MGKKIQQLVWIEPEDFSQVAALSAKTNKAPNTIIAELVARALSNNWEPIKTIEVEKPVIYKRFICKDCLQEFPHLQAARQHKCGGGSSGV